MGPQPPGGRLSAGVGPPPPPDPPPTKLQQVVAAFTKQCLAEGWQVRAMDLSTPEGVKAFYKSDVPQRVCFPAVGLAYRTAIELLQA